MADTQTNDTKEEGAQSDESHKGRTVFVAMDASPNAEYALKWFLQNVHKDDDEVILANCGEYHVAATPTFMATSAMVYQSAVTAQLKKIQEYHEHLKKVLKDKDIKGKVLSLHGIPGETIVWASKENKADLIVTGTRGLGTIRRTILGSVSDYIIHHSEIPVLVVKHKDS